MTTEEELRQKLRKISVLFEGATSRKIRLMLRRIQDRVKSSTLIMLFLPRGSAEPPNERGISPSATELFRVVEADRIRHLEGGNLTAGRHLVDAPQVNGGEGIIDGWIAVEFLTVRRYFPEEVSQAAFNLTEFRS